MNMRLILFCFLTLLFACEQRAARWSSDSFHTTLKEESLRLPPDLSQAESLSDASGDIDFKALNVNYNQQVSNPNLNRKLIKNGSLSMEVNDVKVTKQKAEQLAKTYGGYVSSERQENDDWRLSYTLTIRVPFQHFDTLTLSLEQLSKKVKARSVDVQDVTEEFIDVSARLKTKRELEARYHEILKSAHTVQELLDVERELNNVRSEIESMEGRLKFLTDQVTFSTLNLTFYQTLTADFSFFGQFGNSLGNGWSAFLSFIIGVASLWPFLIMLGVIAWIALKWWRKKKQLTNKES